MWHKHAGMVLNPRLQHRYGFECMGRFFPPLMIEKSPRKRTNFVAQKLQSGVCCGLKANEKNIENQIRFIL